MADKQKITPLKDLIDETLKHDIEKLVSRDDWGAISFEQARQDLERIFSITGHLNLLPLQGLTDTAVDVILEALVQVGEVITRLHSFDITSDTSPAATRDAIVTQIHIQADNYYTVASPWVPFLAYQQGDVAANIKALTSSVEEASQIVETAEENIAAKQLVIDEIVTKTREASAGAGAAVFTEDFNNESSDLKVLAEKWLRITGIFAGGTIIFALALWFLSEPVDNPWQAAQRFGARVIVLIVFFTATLWCGRIYKALMHQSTNNRHRVLSLQTFQAFSAAASDDPTKDAVLLEATRSIFTGLRGLVWV